MELKNYGSESVYADGVEVVGLNANAVSRICLGALCQDVDDTMIDFDTDTVGGVEVERDGARDFFGNTNVTIEIEGNVFDFEVSDHRQVIFIMQKEVGGDRHIIVE